MAGNGHMMMLEKNSADIAKYMGSWLAKNARSGVGRERVEGDAAARRSRRSRPRTSRAKGFFFAGGSYWGEPGKQIMRGAMYTEVLGAEADPAAVPDRLLPRQRADRRATGSRRRTAAPAGRTAWSSRATSSTWWTTRRAADRPTCRCPALTARRRSTATSASARRSSSSASGPTRRERGDFPLKMNHTQWPGTGKIGDPIFDNFMRSQVQFAGASPTLARDAGDRAARQDRHAR